MAVRWSEAMRTALYGPDGFYTRQSPAAHFRTSSQLPPFADAIAEIVRRVDAATGRPEVFEVVDMAAGGGELLDRLSRLVPLEGRLRLTGVEVRPRPPGLPSAVEWREEPPPRVTGLLLACEWLDNVPLDLCEAGDDGVARYQLVDPATGTVTTGEPVSAEDAAWLRRWWPTPPGTVAEIGTTRDAAWRDLTARLDRGLAVAVDYGHTRATRPGFPTLTGFRDGREVAAIPDGRGDVTAHVAMDSPGGELIRQRDALRALGVTGARPDRETALRDPAGYLAALSAAGQAGELLAPGGLGGHWWLLQPAGIHFRL
ncbi:SAM-dependent MidA family methyltransferase [Stackebrandtia albiflava]|uniref:SAM-dependent MidA family methyltransferase n=1 Tax=Stackebrandtia albiflava TaxID=406432 RepID=A0A562V175_9ACTN|nr:SAM-dependent methyltransferase [Stackebrandtia albiflava]TWJ11670.1 SAM-dependent MidA family methyltransferase [Stackebrandtia albiflava]